MFITIQKKELGEWVHTAARFAHKQHTTLPVLACIVIVAGDDGIKFRATNLEIGIDCGVPGEVKSKGVVAVPAKVFEDFVGSLSGEGAVTLEQKGDVLTVSSGKARSILKTVPYEDFPTLPFPEKGGDVVSLSGSTLKSLVLAVLPCASSSSVRPELASVYLYAEGGSLVAVATDSFRLAEKRASGKPGAVLSALVPARSASDLMSAIREDVETQLAVAEHQLAIYQNTMVVTTRLVSASYPDYRQIIPKQFAVKATILRKDFEQALRKISVFADAFQKLRIAFSAKKKSVTLSARNPDIGEATEDMSAAVEGEDAELSFNFRYLQTPLASIGSESLVLEAAGPGRPLAVRGVGDASFLYIVSPMNQ